MRVSDIICETYSLRHDSTSKTPKGPWLAIPMRKADLMLIMYGSGLHHDVLGRAYAFLGQAKSEVMTIATGFDN